MRSNTSALLGEDTGSPSSIGDVRRGNLARVLLAIAAAPAGEYPTRAQLATATKLTKASVSSLVADLMARGLVCEVGLHHDGERGRPGTGLSLDASRCMLGMEINVDYVAAGLVDLTGGLLFECHRARQRSQRSPSAVLDALAELVAQARQHAAAHGLDVLGGALAVPGLVAADGRTVLQAPNLGWDAVILDLERLGPALPLGISLFNEANASALAQQRLEINDAQSFLFVSGEVGIGGGLVINGELYAGPHGHAGELGHVPVRPDGLPCSCGARGCLETVAGQDAIFRAARILGREPGGAQPASSRAQCLESLKSALERSEPQAQQAVAQAAQALAMAIVSTIRLMDLPKVVLGGHFAVLGQWLLPELNAALNTYAPALLAEDAIRLSDLGRSGALTGSAHAMVRSLLEAPHQLPA